MVRYAPNKMPVSVKRRYFELIRGGMKGAEAAQEVGVSLSCGSLWFIDAGRMQFIDRPVSPRYLSQNDRIAIADGLIRGESVKSIAARIGKSYQSVYKEIARNRKPDGRYQPWFAHSQAFQARRRPKVRRLARDPILRAAIAGRLARRWSPVQTSRWLRRRYPRNPSWHLCAETIYEGIYRGLIGPISPANLRTGRTYRRRRGRGRSRDGALKQCTTIRSIHTRPPGVASRREVGHWEGDLILGAGQRSAIATLVERKTRFTLLVRIPTDHSARAVADALITAFRLLPAPPSADSHLGSRERDVPPQTHRTADRAEGILRRPALALATRHQREHQRATPSILPERNRPQYLERNATPRDSRRTQRPPPVVLERPQPTSIDQSLVQE